MYSGRRGGVIGGRFIKRINFMAYDIFNLGMEYVLDRFRVGLGAGGKS
jgi:hypothetical protein